MRKLIILALVLAFGGGVYACGSSTAANGECDDYCNKIKECAKELPSSVQLPDSVSDPVKCATACKAAVLTKMTDQEPWNHMSCTSQAACQDFGSCVAGTGVGGDSDAAETAEAAE